MEVKLDCFACRVSNGRTSCDALKVQNCNKCAFYKSKEQLREERKRYPFRVSPDGYLPKGAET